MSQCPTRNRGESLRKYNLRLSEWAEQERIRAVRMRNLKIGALIDSSLAKSKMPTIRAVTKQTEQSRVSIHDLAAKNPMLAQLVRDIERETGKVLTAEEWRQCRQI